ncbi:DUF6301 family protein [Nocardia sp. NPDC051981]|uniref:DUF6301 family protein n=1 Tax=Nocardia sp. NPDC051981 TaxID=3155417 RepID=UPI00341BE713
MRIDFDRTAEIVRLAASFDWSWSEGDLDTFCETAGWTIDSRRRSGASVTTDLAHDRSDGEVLIHDNLINDIHFFASDVVVESVAEPDQVTRSQFLQLAELLIMHLGSPVPGEPASIVDRLRWDLPKLVVIASFTPDAIHMRLRNPKAQQDDDDWDAHLIDSAYRGADRLSAAEQELESWWRETWGRRVDLRSRGKALGLLSAADFGSWSESHVVYAMSKVTHSMNWPAPEQDAVSFFTDNGDSQLVALRSDEDGDKFGFGEYQLIELTFSIDETDRDAVFVTALDECVQLLGVPDLVGGPEAQAIWRRGATITTLGRGLRPATMWLRIEPMAPRDAAARAAREYGCSWLAWPDESNRRDVGIIGEKEPVIADFAQFETGMDRLFESLTWDLPPLHPYATYVIWQLTSAEHTDWIAQWTAPALDETELPILVLHAAVSC